MIKIGELCTGCWVCLDACPISVLVPNKENNGKVKVEGSCIDCGLCIPACPIDVISMAEEATKEVPEQEDSLEQAEEVVTGTEEEVKEEAEDGTTDTGV
jgi:electron transport complex protein RnfB